jgi:hypothetical protein
MEVFSTLEMTYSSSPREVKALAYQLPAETGTPLARWSCPELAREVVARAIAPAMSASTVRRWLKADTIKPWQYRSWIFIRDPDFQTKAARVLDLYARTFDGEPATCSGVNEGGRPERLRSARAGKPPAANWPRQVRTVSTCTRVCAAIRALERPRPAGNTMIARCRV